MNYIQLAQLCVTRWWSDDGYWVSTGHYEAVAVGNWWYWVSRGHLGLYKLNKVEIGQVSQMPYSLTDFDSATQLLIKYNAMYLSKVSSFLPFQDHHKCSNYELRSFLSLLGKLLTHWGVSFWIFSSLQIGTLTSNLIIRMKTNS